jgi:hypothetical protein
LVWFGLVWFGLGFPSNSKNTDERSLEQTPLHSGDDLDRRIQEIVDAITKAIEASTPKARPSERSIPGWTQECKDAVMTARLGQFTFVYKKYLLFTLL